MFCIAAALVTTGLVRTELARRKVEQQFAPLVIFYPGLLVAVSCLFWLVFFS
jgi:hypothetical protein